MIGAFEFGGGKLGEGELAGLVILVNAVVMRLNFFEVAQKRAFSGGHVAGEGGESLLVVFGPKMGVVGKLPFDLFEAFLIALELPVCAGESRPLLYAECSGQTGS